MAFLTIDLVEESCCICGITFAVPRDWRDGKKNAHVTITCPNGHGYHYPGKSEAEKLRDELTATRARLDQANAATADLAKRVDAEKRKTSAAKGETTKLKNRAAAGVCSCCNRYFANVHRHMLTMHPKDAVGVDPSKGDKLAKK